MGVPSPENQDFGEKKGQETNKQKQNATYLLRQFGDWHRCTVLYARYLFFYRSRPTAIHSD